VDAEYRVAKQVVVPLDASNKHEETRAGAHIVVFSIGSAYVALQSFCEGRQKLEPE
jgi:hypothetical protein